MIRGAVKRLEPLPDELRMVWLPPKEITVPDWVEENVRLPIFTAAEPGPLRIDRTPYTRGPLLALGSPFIEWVVLVWGRQLGKSQGVQYPFLCYCIDQDPGPAICLLPTIDKAKYTSKKRLQPMFDACVAISKKKTTNPDDYSILEMQFINMILSMAWGGSGSQLTTRPSRYLFRDEVDELKRAVGDSAIDPMTAIEQTTSNFPNKKIIDTSTPTTPEGNIWKELKRCQYVFEFWIPCPHCSEYQILYWENVRFGEDHDPQVVENMAYYECEICHKAISNLDKIRMLGRGIWRARKSKEACDQIMKHIRTTPEETISLEDVLENRHVKKIGFHLPKWYSPFSGGTFGIIAREYIEANKILEDGNDFAPIRNWRIYNEAVPWEEVAITETEIELMKNKIDLPPYVCPRGTIALTAGIDPGQGGFWFTVYAWKDDYSSHLVHYGFLRGDYESSDIDKLLGDWVYKVDGEDRQLPIWRVGIDTGGGQYEEADTTMTEAAYLWIRKKRCRWLFGTKGISRETFRRVTEQKIDKMPGVKGEIIPGGIILIRIDTDAMKDVMWFHLRIEEKEFEEVDPETGEILKVMRSPGKMTFHNGTELVFFSHLLAEEKRLSKQGTWEWVRVRKANHWLDCTIIALSMADSEFRGGIRIIRKPPQEKPKQSQTPTQTRLPKKNWVKGW